MTGDDSRGFDGELLSPMYGERFDDVDLEYKAALWQILCEDFFQRYVGPDDVVLDLGAGSCEFINSIRCGKKLVVDLNPEVKQFARDAEVFTISSTAMDPIDSESVDVVFTSNFFEHLPSKEHLLETLVECRRILRPGGKLLVLAPNIRYLGGKYWDYFDHHVPLTHLSMAEGLGVLGYEMQEVVPKFLPYTIKNTRLPRSLRLVRWYLKVRLVWRIFGKQMFIVAVKPHDAPEPGGGARAG